MVGVAKRKYQGEIIRLNKSLNSPLRKIKNILPVEFDEDVIIRQFRFYYPLVWKQIDEMYANYSAKDKVLVKHGMKQRYNPLKPRQYLFSLPQVKHWLSENGKKKHKESFNLERQNVNILDLEKRKSRSLENFGNKINSNTVEMQTVEPLYIDAFIIAYHQKGITIEGKIEIFNELKKYNCKKSIEFFYKLNDAERNNQIRNMAFNHLQSLGKYVKLRKKHKGKTKNYMVEKNEFNMTPEDLSIRIEKDGVQNKKAFNFFISHSLHDRDEVLKVMKILNKQGNNVYCDWTSDTDFLKRNLVNDFTKIVLKKRLDQSKNILLIKSKDSMNSKWVAFELEYFCSMGKCVYYIEIDDTSDSRLDKYLKLRHDFGNDYIQRINEVLI